MSDVTQIESISSKIGYSREDLPPAVCDRFDEILKNLNFLPGSEQSIKLENALLYAGKAHRGRSRLTKEPYITHPLEVMGILADLKLDVTTLQGALLHDVDEGTGITIDDVSQHFGVVVALLADGMTKLSEMRFEKSSSNEEKQAEYFRKMLLSMAQDLRVILIKLADRLHNMRTIHAMPERSRLQMAQETLDIYAPLAHRLGVARVKWELEDTSLKVLDPTSYRRIAERVAMKLEDREESLEKVIKPLKAQLNADGIEANIYGRAKHFYSIYNKIRVRGKSFEEILDLLAIRVIVNTIPECYQALGQVHSLFNPIAEKFTDFIARPKGNMYRSLHTKVMDNSGRVIEVQIRTHEMDLIAAVGIAAHWQYKRGNDKTPLQDDSLQKYYLWVRKLIEGSLEENSSEEFMADFKVNISTDEIIVFTPKGELVSLPKKASPVDFAFAVHTNIGLSVLGAKVNGKMVSLKHELRTGDKVEILTSSNANPSMDWLQFVKSSKARNRIKRYFKQIRFEESVRIGEELLSKEINLPKNKIPRQVLGELLNGYGQPSLEAFFAAIGSGEISTQSVKNRLNGGQEQKKKKTSLSNSPRKKRNGTGVKVHGHENVMITFANCCDPLPGESILGFISKGRGIRVHRIDCPNIGELMNDEEHIVDVEWDTGRSDRFQARLRVYAENRNGLLLDIAEAINKLDIGIIEANLRTEGSLAVGTLVIEVSSLSVFSKVMSRIHGVSKVLQVERVNVADVVEKL
ncbi:bifunctional (p)ppGpp synthetase/guanosine-3',5'-bis(diphosphate) 3'-pyrophosphohydrolase [bacterium]|nr:bifunctional (p)ppGpp synthetase/guanosine-3',5'-bis(diphosphate) 3'-pyrophosphohydrolase [bacterium]